jgi:NUMOD3 motif
VTSIYALLDPRDWSIRYVGKTRRTLGVRLSAHMTTRSGGWHRDRWVAKLRRLGLRPSISLVQEVPDADADGAERYWISYFRLVGCALTNGTAGGDGGPMTPEAAARHRAVMASPETRARNSAAHAGVPLSVEWRAALKVAQQARRLREMAEGTTRKWTPEERQRIGDQQRGKRRGIMSVATRERIADRARGRRATPEVRAKIGAATRSRQGNPNQGMRGKHHTPETRALLAARSSAWWEAQHA